MFSSKKKPSQIPQKRIQLVMTPVGVIIMTVRPNGEVSSHRVDLVEPASQPANGVNGHWAIGRPIQMIPRQAEGASPTAGSSTWVLNLKFDGDDKVHQLYSADNQDELSVVSQLVLDSWTQMNSIGAAQAGTAMVPAAAEAVPRQPANAAQPIAYTPDLSAAPAASAAGGKKSRLGWWALGIVGMSALVAASWAVTSYKLRPAAGPGLDLSSMSIEDVAAMEANPAVIKGVQATMMEAVGYGREQGAGEAAKMEAQHQEALKAMGLELGASGRNALGCLAK